MTLSEKTVKLNGGIAQDRREGAVNSINDARATKERKALNVFIGLSLTVVVCSFPQSVFQAIYMANPNMYSEIVDVVTSFLWGFTTVVHPIVYQLLNEDLRQLIFR